MPITLICPSCGKKLRAKDEQAGKKVKCPACQNAIAIPTMEDELSPVDLAEKLVSEKIGPDSVTANANHRDREPTNVKPGKYCRTCGNQVLEQAVACMKCGVPPKTGNGFCYYCGAETRAEAVICVKCGMSCSTLEKVNSNGASANTKRSLYAGFEKRLGACVIDNIIVAIPFGIVLAIVSEIYGDEKKYLATLITINYARILLIDWLYYALMEASPTQGSLGKMLLKIKVTDLHGNRIGFGRATGRYFSSIISGVALGIGYLRILWSDRRQAMHDIWAGCLVVNKK